MRMWPVRVSCYDDIWQESFGEAKCFMKCFIYDKSNWYSVWVAMRMRTEFDAFSLKREKTDERWWPSKGTSHITVASLLTTSTGTRVALLCELCPLCGLVELLGATNWHYSTSILHSGKNHLPGRSSSKSDLHSLTELFSTFRRKQLVISPM